MQKYDSTTDYLSGVIQRLNASGFHTINNVIYKDQVFQCVAKRTKFQLEFFGFAETFFIFAELSFIDRIILRQFSNKCFKFAMKSKGLPLPCGLFESVFCFPVALVNGIDYTTGEAVRNEEPPKHWSAFEMPVICDPKAGLLYYTETTPRLGSAAYDYLRATIRNMLTP